MFNLIEKLLVAILEAFFGEALHNIDIIDGIMDNFPETAFRVERVIGAVLNTALVQSLYTTTLSFGIALIVLKFMKKGFETYILWTDGDPDADPIGLLTSFFKAIAVSLSFAVMYDWIVEATVDFINLLQATISDKSPSDILTFLENCISQGFVKIVFVIAFLIFGMMLYFQFMKRGIEMIVLRIGMPLACMGLLDSDNGVFKPYMQKFFQSALTVVVQIILGKIGLLLCLNGNFFWSFAVMSVALATPKFLQEFMIGAGGGGGIGNVYHMSSMARGAAAPIMRMIKK